MRAVVLPGDGSVEVVDRPTPVPGENEVLVEMAASAICRSDMSLYRGTPLVGSASLKRVVPGHEAAGTVVEVGKKVKSVSVGQRVAIYLAVGCGHCAHCFEGQWMLCRGWSCFGFDFDGGDEEAFVVPEGNCLPLPKEISDVGGSVLTDMVGTQFEGQRRWGVSGGDRLVIFGLGPMGCAGVMVGHGLGAEVIGVDPLAARRARATRLGASEVLDPEKFAERCAQGLLGEGAEFAVECSGSEQGQNAALDSIRPEGHVLFVGERDTTRIEPSRQVIRKLVNVHGAWYFSRWRYEALTDFVVRRKLPLDELVSETVGLGHARAAFERFDAREVEKVVFVTG